MEHYNSEQEFFWAGKFGDDYTQRNKSTDIYASNISLFAHVFSSIDLKITSLIEFGPNIGLNLMAIKKLLPHCELSGVEINEKVVKELQLIDGLKVYHDSIFEFKLDYPRDFVLTKGLLIHLNPKMLAEAYEKIYSSSNCYICLAEYYNPKPVEVNYRGYEGKLFKRDFAGEMLDKYQDLSLVDYGFIYHRDNTFPLDDITWFLLKK